MRLFNCAMCDKGYARQIDYENHLSSYDHTHRQRIADLKKINAAKEAEDTQPRYGGSKRDIDFKGATKSGGGPRFSDTFGKDEVPIGGGGRFKKVGVTVSGPSTNTATKKEGIVPTPATEAPAAPKPEAAKEPEKEADVKEAEVKDGQATEEDVVVASAQDNDDNSSEISDWGEYDFTKPTGCDHANCPGCKTEGIWDGWVPLPGWTPPS